MGTEDQFKDKASELEEQAMRARRIAMGEAGDEETKRVAQGGDRTKEEPEGRPQDRSQGRPQDRSTEKAMQEDEDRLNQDYDA
jgi:hypothetical protein